VGKIIVRNNGFWRYEKVRFSHRSPSLLKGFFIKASSYIYEEAFYSDKK